MIRRLTRLIVFSLMAVLLFACSQQEPVQIIITPTPDLTNITPSATPTSDPTDTPTVTATDTTAPTVTATPSATVETTAQVVPPTFSGGPLVATEYVRPTFPPVTVVIPTVTPTPGGPTNTPGPSPTPRPGLDPNQMGIQMYSQLSFNDFMAAVGLAEGTGVTWVKVQVNWDFLQPTQPNDWNEQMQLFERQMEALARAGFNVLLSVAKAPGWSRSVLDESGPPDNSQDLADFITFMLNTKIGESVNAIEVWNEPNLAREWRGTLPFNGAGYMQLFEPAYQAIRAYSPTMTIVTAGLAPTGALPNTVDDRVFLTQMYQNGLANYTDIAVGIHPYGWGNPPDVRCCDAIPDRGWDDDPHFFFLDTIEEYRAIMVQNGHENIQMWTTEFGWASWEGLEGQPPEEWMIYNTARLQADYALRAFEIGQERPYLGPMFLWNLNFANGTLVANRDERAAYSIINPVLPVRERPLFWALAEVTGALVIAGQ